MTDPRGPVHLSGELSLEVDGAGVRGLVALPGGAMKVEDALDAVEDVSRQCLHAARAPHPCSTFPF